MPGLASDLAPLLAGKVVIDTGNAYEKRDGASAREASSHPGGSAGWAAGFFPNARWVKGFNTVYFKTLESEAHREGDRVGIPLASDDRDAMQLVAGLVRDAGFDPVIVGPLARGKEFEPGAPVYNTGMSGREVRDPARASGRETILSRTFSRHDLLSHIDLACTVRDAVVLNTLSDQSVLTCSAFRRSRDLRLRRPGGALFAAHLSEPTPSNSSTDGPSQHWPKRRSMRPA